MYGIYLFFSIDARVANPFISIPHTKFFLLYLFFVVFGVLSDIVIRGRNRIHNRETFLFFSGFFCMYVLAFFREYSSLEEIVLAIMILVITFCNAYLVCKNNCIIEFVKITVSVIACFFILICIRDGVKVLELISKLSLSGLFSANYAMRIRIWFNFKNVNAVGNLVSCALVLLPMIYKAVFVYEGNKIIIHKILYVLITVWLYMILLLSGSRTAMIIVAIDRVMLLYYSIRKRIKSNQRVIVDAICAVLFGVMAIIILLNLLGTFLEARGFAFENIKLLTSLRERLLGLGMIAPGKYPELVINGKRGDFLDNYYIYLYLTFGIVGVMIFFTSIVKVIISLLKKSKISPNDYMVLCCMISCLLGGLGETSVFYHIFPSSVIYFSLIFARMNYKRSFYIEL